jgi:hypothetical protein
LIFSKNCDIIYTEKGNLINKIYKKKEEKVMNKKTNDALRADYVQKIMQMMTDAGEEVLRVKSNEIALPVVDADGEDNWVIVTIKVPVGSRDGDVYDGYGEAESYTMNQEAKAEKAKLDAEKKAKKIARDKAQREQKAAIKAKREG